MWVHPLRSSRQVSSFTRKRAAWLASSIDTDRRRRAYTTAETARRSRRRQRPMPMRRPDVWPAADLALRQAVERVWELDPLRPDFLRPLGSRPSSPRRKPSEYGESAAPIVCSLSPPAYE